MRLQISFGAGWSLVHELSASLSAVLLDRRRGLLETPIAHSVQAWIETEEVVLHIAKIAEHRQTYTIRSCPIPDGICELFVCLDFSKLILTILLKYVQNISGCVQSIPFPYKMAINDWTNAALSSFNWQNINTVLPSLSADHPMIDDIQP